MMCTVSITTDGINYSESEEKFKIYSNQMNLQTLNPKSGSIKGGTELTLFLELDPVTSEDLFYLLVGFNKNTGGASNKGKNEAGDGSL
jgi:hypothetical protein